MPDVSYFTCPSGKCLRPDLLCDSDKNCDDGTDEIRCGKEHFKVESLIIFGIFVCDDDIFYFYFPSGMNCPKDKFSCADGGCVSWTLACNGENNCEDGTDEPLFCEKQGEL